jgi:hypothetical protein
MVFFIYCPLVDLIKVTTLPDRIPMDRVLTLPLTPADRRDVNV